MLPRWARRGHGGRLLAAAAAELRHVGITEGSWWILENDVASVRFVEAAGWSARSRRTLDTGAAPLVELRFAGGLDLVAV